MVNRRLSSSEAAQRLGIKAATLYSYVSRGLLHPERGPRGSTFDPREVAQLARTARRPGNRPAAVDHRRSGDGSEPVFVTGVSLIDSGRLFYRGRDAVEMSRASGFEAVAEWLWSGDDGDAEAPWEVLPGAAGPLESALTRLPESATPLERFAAALMVASLRDELRHDLNPAGVPVTGRSLLATLAAALPRHRSGPPPGGPMSHRVWTGLSPMQATPGRLAVVDAAMVLAADHELAPSTLAARVAASFRADVYAVVLTALGPAGGSWPPGSTGAPSEVEALLAEAGEVGAERALGERLKRWGSTPHGFGMPLYPAGDPRAAALLDRLGELGTPERHEVVRRVVEVGAERGFPPANFDLGLGAISYCGAMVPGAGQAIFTLAKVAGWLAHAAEEYGEPTRFRIRSDYVGPVPEAMSSRRDRSSGAGPAALG